MSSRAMSHLSPVFLPFATSFLAECFKQGLDILVYCTLRSLEEQGTLYAQGRTCPGHIVTNARPGQSAHNYGLAFDGVPLVGGKPVWSEPLSGPHWRLYGEAANTVGVQWGGAWHGFVEGPHIEMMDWQNYIPPPTGTLAT